jgi:hypothetical protein
MTNRAKDKGDRAELEAAAMLNDLLRLPQVIRRRLGAGRTSAAGGDVGDLDGVPDHVVQVANWSDAAAAARQKPAEAEQQAVNLGVQHSITLVRFRGGRWVVVLSLAQWVRYFKLLFTNE